MVLFSDLSNKEKVDFLLNVKDLYVKKYTQGDFFSLCRVVRLIYIRWFGDVCNESVFMGDDIWNYKFAGVCQLDDNLNGYWWPLDDFVSRINFINRLIHLYNV